MNNTNLHTGFFFEKKLQEYCKRNLNGMNPALFKVLLAVYIIQETEDPKPTLSRLWKYLGKNKRWINYGDLSTYCLKLETLGYLKRSYSKRSQRQLYLSLSLDGITTAILFSSQMTGLK